MAYEQLEPFGANAQFIGSAIVATTVANRHRGKKEKPHKLEEFMPVFDKKKPEPKKMVQAAEMITIMYNEMDKANGK